MSGLVCRLSAAGTRGVNLPVTSALALDYRLLSACELDVRIIAMYIKIL